MVPRYGVLCCTAQARNSHTWQGSPATLAGHCVLCEFVLIRMVCDRGSNPFHASMQPTGRFAPPTQPLPRPSWAGLLVYVLQPWPFCCGVSGLLEPNLLYCWPTCFVAVSQSPAHYISGIGSGGFALRSGTVGNLYVCGFPLWKGHVYAVCRAFVLQWAHPLQRGFDRNLP